LQSLAVSLSATAQVVHRLAQKQVELGSRPGVDTAQTGLEVTRAHQQEIRALVRVRQAEVALNTAMGRSPSATISRIALPLVKREMPTVDLAINQTLAARSEITEEMARRDVLSQEMALPPLT
jgi:outer membrane protein TolC